VVRNHHIILAALILLLMVGCAGTMPGPGQPFPGGVFSSTVQPAGMTIDQEYEAFPERFEILGLTEGTSSNSNILGIVSVGDGGYIAAMQDAMQRVGADGLINCVADVKSTGVLFIFSSSKTVVRGLAIKRKE
jgi:hypothetical protein